MPRTHGFRPAEQFEIAAAIRKFEQLIQFNIVEHIQLDGLERILANFVDVLQPTVVACLHSVLSFELVEELEKLLTPVHEKRIFIDDIRMPVQRLFLVDRVFPPNEKELRSEAAFCFLHKSSKHTLRTLRSGSRFVHANTLAECCYHVACEGFSVPASCPMMLQKILQTQRQLVPIFRSHVGQEIIVRELWHRDNLVRAMRD